MGERMGGKEGATKKAEKYFESMKWCCAFIIQINLVTMREANPER